MGGFSQGGFGGWDSGFLNGGDPSESGSVNYSIVQTYTGGTPASVTFTDTIGGDWVDVNPTTGQMSSIQSLEVGPIAVAYAPEDGRDTDNALISSTFANNNWTFTQRTPGSFTATANTVGATGWSFSPGTEYLDTYTGGYFDETIYSPPQSISFTDGTGSPMIATITVTGTSGTWNLNTNILNAGATADQVKTALGDITDGDTVTSSQSGNTITYTITTNSDYSSQVSTAANINLTI